MMMLDSIASAMELQHGERNVNSIDIKRYNDMTVITINSRLDMFSAPNLVRQFNQLIEEGTKQFVVDLSRVRVIDADGDYPLLHLVKRATDIDGSVTLVCPPGNPVRVLYEITKFDQFFNMVETLDAVIENTKD